MSLDRKTVAAIVPAAALTVSMAMMPPTVTPSPTARLIVVGTMPPLAELRPMHGPLEVRTPRIRR